MLAKAFTTSESQEWSTPFPIFNGLKEKYHYDIDLCASKTNRKLDNYLGLDQGVNSLDVDWHTISKSGWINPPYGDKVYPVKYWIEKAFEQWEMYNYTSSLLLPINKQDQPWFHKYCINTARIEIFQGRIQFVDPITGKIPLKWNEEDKKWVKNGNSQGSMLITFGFGAGFDSLIVKEFY